MHRQKENFYEKGEKLLCMKLFSIHLRCRELFLIILFRRIKIDVNKPLLLIWERVKFPSGKCDFSGLDRNVGLREGLVIYRIVVVNSRLRSSHKPDQCYDKARRISPNPFHYFQFHRRSFGATLFRFASHNKRIFSSAIIAQRPFHSKQNFSMRIHS